MTMTTAGTGWGALHLAVRVPALTAVCVGAFYALNTADQNPMVVFTFDDGWVTQYDNALPILFEAEFSATAFLTEALIGGDKYMKEEHHATLSANGWEIGSHTRTHPFLTQLDEGDQWQEISYMPDGAEVVSFSSPYGDYNESVVGKVKFMYDYHVNAWSDAMGVNTVATWDPYNIHRLNVRWDTLPEDVCETVSKLEDNELFVLIFHEVKEVIDLPLAEGEKWTVYSEDNFRKIVDCVKLSGLRTPTLAQAADHMDTMSGLERD